MKPVKAWKAIKIWQEEGRGCRPVHLKYNKSFGDPMGWINRLGYGIEFEVEKKRIQFEAEAYTNGHPEVDIELPGIVFNVADNIQNRLKGKRWRVTCEQIAEEE